MSSNNTGIVIKSTGSWYKVKSDSFSIDCRIKGKFRLNGIRSTNPIAVGDIVDFAIDDEEENVGIITNIHERKNYIIRKSANLSKQSHIIAANVDQAFLIVTIASPTTHISFIDRLLVVAEAYKIPAILVFNKTDLYNKSDLEKLAEWEHIYSKIGYECMHCNIFSQENIDAIKMKMKNKTNVFIGNSGVGKSSIINQIDSSLNLRVGNISKQHTKGMHTTTYAEMFELDFGGYIVDTPGIKAFGLLEMEKHELYHFFPEIFEKSEECKFYNCTHIHEPGCAVLKALENNEISATRYKSYLSMINDENDKHRKGF
jgi:ribosome biogenesis GTPase / thiamine phosphate phosphatase